MKKGILLAVAGALLASTAPAMAAVFNWTYEGDLLIRGSGTVSASGTFTTTDTTSTVGGRQAYTVTGITGTRNGVGITGLATTFPTIFGGADNFLFSTGAPFSDLGVSFSLANGRFGNFFDDGGVVGEYGAANIAGDSGLTNAQGVFSFSPATGVPEPATWAMMIAGFGLAGCGLRRREAKLANA